jgi:type IV pilus assembly protein PilQ
MKKYLFKIFPAFIILWIFLCSPGVITELRADQNKSNGGQTLRNIGYLENVLFERLTGRERVTLVVSEPPLIGPPSIQSDNSLLIKLENLFAPDHMRQTLGQDKLLNVTGVKAQQQTADGKQWVNLIIYLKENVPYCKAQCGFSKSYGKNSAGCF